MPRYDKEWLQGLLAKPGYSLPEKGEARPMKSAKSPAQPILTTTEPVSTPVNGRGRIRQNAQGLNKTEQAFHDWLNAEWPGVVFHTQSVTLKIANGCRYTPDEFCCFTDTGCEAWEVKGFMRDDAAVKLKVAASLYPWITFHLVTKLPKKKGGGWNIQEVLP